MATRKYKPIEITPVIAKRFWSRVDKTPGQGPKGRCWTWKGYVDRLGYGTTRVGKKVVLVHRISYTLRFGPIPKGMNVLHKCDVYNCVRCIYSGSQLQNMRDCRERGRNRKARGSNHGCAKLTEQQVKKIRKSNDTTTAIATKFNVDQTTVSLIRLRRIWKHI